MDDSILATLVIRDGQYELRSRGAKGAERSKFLSPEDVAAAFRDEPTDSGWIPAGIVRLGRSGGRGFAVGWFPPRRHTCGFVRHEGKESLEALMVPLPAMVFAGHGREHAVWAIKEDAFDPRAAACHTPTPNVYEGGAVCWGVNTPPPASAGSLATAFELFLGTNSGSPITRRTPYPPARGRDWCGFSGTDAELSGRPP
ncbi:MAG: hypothetical protein U0166_00405 [Acidobacteriota bacterium]